MSHSKNKNPQEPEALQKQEPDEESLGQVSSPEVNIGNLLRHERERKGLSYSEISEITCLRAHILKALENEDWENLPSPVFVTGFIRSYASALGLDEGEVVSLYQKKVPREAPIPKPLVEPVRSKKPLYILFVFLLLAMAAAYYLWKEYPTQQEILTGPETITPTGNEIKQPEIPKDLPAPDETPPSEIQEETALMPQAILKTNEGEDQQVQAEGKKEETALMPQAVLRTTNGEAQDLTAEETGEQEDIRSSITKPAQPTYEILPPIEDFPLTLRASVREKTWVKIYVDEGDPKEYIFKPGSRHEWKARKGFDLLIGNAGGIDLEFNGEKIENIGANGQVVRLVFPQYYIERSPN